MRYSFAEAMKDAQELVLSPRCKTEIFGFYVDVRVERETVPKNWFAYEMRGTSSGSLDTIEEGNVLADFIGTFLTETPIPFKKYSCKGTGYRCLNGRGGYTFL